MPEEKTHGINDLHLRAGRQTKMPGDDEALDFRSARIEAGGDVVAQVSFDLVLTHVAVAAVNLDRIERRCNGGFADCELRDGALERVRLPAPMRPGGAIEHHAAGFE